MAAPRPQPRPQRLILHTEGSGAQAGHLLEFCLLCWIPAAHSALRVAHDTNMASVHAFS